MIINNYFPYTVNDYYLPLIELFTVDDNILPLIKYL